MPNLLSRKSRCFKRHHHHDRRRLTAAPCAASATAPCCWRLAPFRGRRSRSEGDQTTMAAAGSTSSIMVCSLPPRGKTGWREGKLGRRSSDATCLVVAVENWIRSAKLIHVPLFRRVTGRGKPVGPAHLNDREVARLIGWAAMGAGVRVRPAKFAVDDLAHCGDIDAAPDGGDVLLSRDAAGRSEFNNEGASCSGLLHGHFRIRHESEDRGYDGRTCSSIMQDRDRRCHRREIAVCGSFADGMYARAWRSSAS